MYNNIIYNTVYAKLYTPFFAAFFLLSVHLVALCQPDAGRNPIPMFALGLYTVRKFN